MWFVLDGLGIALGVLTWALFGFADWVVVRHVFMNWFWTASPRVSFLPFTDLGTVLFLLYQALVILSWFSHFQAATTDPGTIPISTAPPEVPAPKICKLCNGRWKPPRAHHCKTCHRCIFRMDHHCPWINNCVGLANQKLFMLFLGYTALACILTLLLLGGSGIYWLMSQKSWADAAPPSSAALICSGLVVLECLAGMLFVSDFLQEQIESIQMNSTLVETYQRTHGKRTTMRDHFCIVFGWSWWVWPIPFPTAPYPDYKEQVVADDQDGYCFPDDVDSLNIAGMESEAAAVPHSDLRQRGHGGLVAD